MFESAVFLGLGTNIGNRLQNLQNALSNISNIPSTYILDYSSIYETAPVGYLQQGDFLNMAAKISTWIYPDRFLSVLKQIEFKMGRQETIKWGPRLIDIDILLWGKTEIRSEALKIPHPENENRTFVQVPLREILPGFMATQDTGVHSSELTLHIPRFHIEF